MMASSPVAVRTVALVALLVAFAVDTDAKLAPALTPPHGWRSWNCFLLGITQEKILGQVKALTAKHGDSPSLLDLGYVQIGVDDGWQACGSGVGGSFHDASGKPLINTSLFPNVTDMVAQAHALNVQVGWYDNNCYCSGQENKAWGKGFPNGGNVDQDVQLLIDANFDGVKVDGCGPAHNITKWTLAVDAAPQDIVMENCGDNDDHWSPPNPADIAHSCGFSQYRISTDIAPQFYSTMFNLNQFPIYADVSRPGCWAYPDMLQVGNWVSNKGYTGGLNAVESRTHFAAWCIVSAPLILGFDLTNTTAMAMAYPIISNKVALSINNAWAGHAGRLVANSTATFSAYARHGAGADGGTTTTFYTWQVWAKPLGKNQFACLIINLSESPVDVSVSLSDIGIPTADATLLEVWTGQTSKVSGHLSATGLASHDSVFVVLTPSHAE